MSEETSEVSKTVASRLAKVDSTIASGVERIGDERCARCSKGDRTCIAPSNELIAKRIEEGSKILPKCAQCHNDSKGCSFAPTTSKKRKVESEDDMSAIIEAIEVLIEQGQRRLATTKMKKRRRVEVERSIAILREKFDIEEDEGEGQDSE